MKKPFPPAKAKAKEYKPAMKATGRRGEYQPTAKNGVVADLYPRMGFAADGDAFFVRELGGDAPALVTYIAEG